MRLRSVTERSVNGWNKCGVEGEFFPIARTKYAGTGKVQATARENWPEFQKAGHVLLVNGLATLCPAHLPQFRQTKIFPRRLM
jgi:hypothetical protein